MSLRYPELQPLSLERARILVADPARQRLFDQILAAVSRDEIEPARVAHHRWRMDDPDDFGMLEAGERLAYAEEALTDDLALTPPTDG